MFQMTRFQIPNMLSNRFKTNRFQMFVKNKTFIMVEMLDL